MISIIIGILWFFIILRWDVYSDYDKWLKKIPVNHSRDFKIRILLLLPCYGLLLYPELQDHNNTIWHIFNRCVVVLGLIGSTWWELFDGWYNTKRGYKWRFDGTKDTDDSKFDKIRYNLSDTEEAFIKIGLIVIFLGLYLFT